MSRSKCYFPYKMFLRPISVTKEREGRKITQKRFLLLRAEVKSPITSRCLYSSVTAQGFKILIEFRLSYRKEAAVNDACILLTAAHNKEPILSFFESRTNLENSIAMTSFSSHIFFPCIICTVVLH